MKTEHKTILKIALLFVGAFLMTFVYEIESFRYFLGDKKCESGFCLSQWEWGIRHWILFIATIAFYLYVIIKNVGKYLP